MDYSKNKIIGIAGQMRSGKNTTSEYLRSFLNKTAGYEKWGQIEFSDSMKKIICKTFGVDLEFIEKWKVINENAPGFDMPMRDCLIQIGDGFRKIRSTIWIDLMLKDIKGPVTCPSCRYINELKSIKNNNGINILLSRPGYLNDIKNDSESQIKPLIQYFLETTIDGKVPQNCGFRSDAPRGVEYIDFFIRNDGTLEDLKKKVEKAGEIIKG